MRDSKDAQPVLIIYAYLYANKKYRTMSDSEKKFHYEWPVEKYIFTGKEFSDWTVQLCRRLTGTMWIPLKIITRVRTWCGSQGVSGGESVRRQVVARDGLFATVGVLLNVVVLVLLQQLSGDGVVTLWIAALIVWLALSERRIIVRDAKAKSSGQTLLRTEKRIEIT